MPARPFNIDRLLRLAHGYMGMLIAPSLLFFAASGGLQVFRLNEAHGDYKPPAAFVVMGAFHKNQAAPRPRSPQGDQAGGPGRGAGRDGPGEGRGGRDRGPRPPPKPSTLALKWLSVGVSIALFLSTALGIWMGLRDRLRRGVNLALLALGAIVPLALALV